MALKLNKGDRVLVELTSSEIYEGNVEYVSSPYIELYDIFCPKTSTNYPGNMTFYKNEVLHVSKVSGESVDAVSANGNFPKIKKITMDPDEFNRLKQITFDFIFVDSFGKRFDEAVEVLSNRESIAVVGLGNNLRRNGVGLLLMADFKQVYIFDLMWLVHLKGLQDILESTFITKVVHDGSALYDCLQHKYKVEMKNVFDTKIVDSMLAEKEGGHNVSRSISEILSYHFNFPPSLLSAAVDDMIDKTWMERPIVKSDRIKAAQLVAYLLPLRDKLMTQILKPYSNAIQSEYDKFKKSRDSSLLRFQQ